jgi:hypothetical protein
MSMTNTRKERLIHEILGPDSLDDSHPERTLLAVVLVAFLLGVVVAASPSRNSSQVIASSPIDAVAAPKDTSRWPAPDANATQGNVDDMTY